MDSLVAGLVEDLCFNHILYCMYSSVRPVGPRLSSVPSIQSPPVRLSVVGMYVAPALEFKKYLSIHMRQDWFKVELNAVLLISVVVAAANGDIGATSYGCVLVDLR